MLKKEITFDSFIRGLLVLGGVVVAYLLLKRLSGVLLPFFVAWMLAYLIYPLVSFLQYRLHLRFRVPCIILALIIVMAAATGLVLLVVPPTVRELSALRGPLVDVFNHFGQSPIAQEVDQYIEQHIDQDSISQLFKSEDIRNILQSGLGHVWELIGSVLSLLKGVMTFVLVLLYLFFILMDYEHISNGFTKLVPAAYRESSTHIFDDVKTRMNAYFRGQALIAFLVGVLFSIGFSIIGMPVAIGLGMFIGLLNLVPYLQVVGIFPACLLAFLRSTQTGESFWLILFYCFLVFIVVQSIQDLILTPKIMGKVMGLKPAIIFLSLSVWGSLLGFIGLVIALPLTTLVISYYRIFVLKEKPSSEESKEEVQET